MNIRLAFPSIAKSIAIALCLLLTGCGGGGGSSTGSSGGGGNTGGASTYTLGGSIAGLTGSGLELTMTDGSQSAFPISGAKSYLFPTALKTGATYSVKVGGSPPGLECTVANASGTVASTNITNINVTCAAISYAIGGTIQGLTVDGLVLSEGVDHLEITAGTTSFAFPTPVPFGSSYYVLVSTQPSGKTCTVANQIGIISANVTNVMVTCVVETVVHSFASANLGDGGEPRGDLIQDGQGTLYGTTNFGGANGSGTVFKLSPPSATQSTWSETVLYSFGASNSGDALQPHGGLVLDDLGNLYGTTSLGGTLGLGTVFMLSPPIGGQTEWSENVLWSFGSLLFPDGSDPEAGLTRDNAGNLYGTTFFGGALEGGCVFRLAPPSSGQTAWAETILYSFGTNGASDGNESSAPLFQDSQGNLYSTTQGGGEFGGGTVFKLAPPAGSETDWTETVLYSFGTSSSTDGYFPTAALISDNDGNLYGTTKFGGTIDKGTVFRVASPTGGQTTWTETVIHSFQDYALGDGAYPVGALLRDGQGNIYGTAPEGGPYSSSCIGEYSDNGVVFKISPPDGTQLDWIETVLYGFRGPDEVGDGCAPESGLTQGANGHLYGTTLQGGTGPGTVFEIVP